MAVEQMLIRFLTRCDFRENTANMKESDDKRLY